MFVLGDKVSYYGRDAVILNASDDEVLIFIDPGYIKWVDKNLLNMFQTKLSTF